MDDLCPNETVKVYQLAELGGALRFALASMLVGFVSWMDMLITVIRHSQHTLPHGAAVPSQLYSGCTARQARATIIE